VVDAAIAAAHTVMKSQPAQYKLLDQLHRPYLYLLTFPEVQWKINTLIFSQQRQ
jgi:hypothetical protein